MPIALQITLCICVTVVVLFGMLLVFAQTNNKK